MSQDEVMKNYWVRVQKEFAGYDRLWDKISYPALIAELGDEFWKLCRAQVYEEKTSGTLQNACIRVAAIAAALYRMEREFPSSAI